MDKEKYVEGLLAFYELDRIDVLKSAYIQGYLATASRYDAYMGRDRAEIELEARRRADIHACVSAYVDASIREGHLLDVSTFTRERFAGESADLQARLAERVSAIIASLNDANHIAYGLRGTRSIVTRSWCGDTDAARRCHPRQENALYKDILQFIGFI